MFSEERSEMNESYLSRHTDLSWTNIGRDSDGAAEDAVQQSLALRPPHHLTSFIRLAPSSNRGATNTGPSTLIFVVLEGEINVMINHILLTAVTGDNFYVPAETNYSLINQSETTVELFLVQYKYLRIQNKQEA